MLIQVVRSSGSGVKATLKAVWENSLLLHAFFSLPITVHHFSNEQYAGYEQVHIHILTIYVVAQPTINYQPNICTFTYSCLPCHTMSFADNNDLIITFRDLEWYTFW